MVRLLISLLLSLISLLVNAQVRQTQKISGSITSIDVSMPISVYIDASKDSDVVEIITDKEDSAGIISVVQSGTKLTVGIKYSKSKLRLLGKVEVHISQKGIVNYNVGTAGKVNMKGRTTGDNVKIALDSSGFLNANFSANSIVINLDSASKYVGNVTSKNMKVSIDSAAKVEVSGDVETLTVNVDSAASFMGKALKAKHVKAEVDSMGKAEVYPTESLNAYADSMGKVVYYNTPKELKKYTDSMGSVKSSK